MYKISLFNNWRQADDGSTAMVYAIILPVLIGMGALAVEAGHYQQRNARIQSAADMAALAAVLEYKATNDRGKASLAARGTAVENGYVLDGGSLTIESPIRSGPFAGNEGAIVRIEQTQERFLSKIFSVQSNVVQTVEATVTAPMVGKPVCSLALDPDAVDAISITGNSDITMESCAIHANSEAVDAFTRTGSGSIVAECASATGTVSGIPDRDLGCGEAKSEQPLVKDPYGDVEVNPAAVASMGCNQIIRSTATNRIVLSPGRYGGNCGYSEIVVDTALRLSGRGAYFFDGVDINFKGKGSMSGTTLGTTMVFLNGGSIENTNGGEMELYAQSEGPYAGIVMYADRNTSNPDELVRINGNQGARFEGAL